MLHCGDPDCTGVKVPTATPTDTPTATPTGTPTATPSATPCPDNDGDTICDAVDPDDDDDGMPDQYENAHSCLDPLVPDGTADADADGLSNLTEFGLGTDPCMADTDWDGCSDGREVKLSDPVLGGARDPLYFWDFYDVWSQVSPGAWERDKTVDLFNDIVGVISRFGTTWDSPLSKAEALAEALTPPPSGDKDGYHAAFDRGPSAGPNPWNMTAPDGIIDLFNDIVGVIQQFGHDCA